MNLKLLSGLQAIMYLTLLFYSQNSLNPFREDGAESAIGEDETIVVKERK